MVSSSCSARVSCHTFREVLTGGGRVQSTTAAAVLTGGQIFSTSTTSTAATTTRFVTRHTDTKTGDRNKWTNGWMKREFNFDFSYDRTLFCLIVYCVLPHNTLNFRLTLCFYSAFHGAGTCRPTCSFTGWRPFSSSSWLQGQCSHYHWSLLTFWPSVHPLLLFH